MVKFREVLTPSLLQLKSGLASGAAATLVTLGSLRSRLMIKIACFVFIVFIDLSVNAVQVS